MKPYAVGVDLGGTNIKGGIVRRDGTVVVRRSIPTEVSGGAEHVIARIASVVTALIAEAQVERGDVAAVCVGAPGPLDSKTGLIYEAPNLGWRDVRLGDILSPQVQLPVFVENDANVAGYGEAWAGAARGSSCTILLTLGTGIGGGVVLNGDIWRGVTDTGAELGHMSIDFDGPQCGCGSRGCIEAYASATAVARRMREAVRGGRDSSLKARILAGEDVDSKAIHDAALSGDALSREIIEETGRLLGVAAANYVNIFNPDCIVFHGGMVNAGEMLFGPLVATMKGRCFASSQRGLRVLPSALKGDAGIVGAAGMAFRRSAEGA